MAAAPEARGPGLIGRVASSAALEFRRRIPKADLDERDPDYIRDQLPFLWMLSSLYLRAEVRGMENIPEDGPVLMVGNHSGGNMIVDTFAFTLAFETHFGVERPFYQLAHNLVLLLGQFMPWVPNLRKFGTVAAGHENAERALKSGAAVLVYPGGDYETHRPSWESAQVDFGGRKGFIRLALNSDVPLVPITEDEVRDYVRSRLARFKAPRGVTFVGELPRNATGKVVKRDLEVPQKKRAASVSRGD